VGYTVAGHLQATSKNILIAPRIGTGTRVNPIANCVTTDNMGHSDLPCGSQLKALLSLHCYPSAIVPNQQLCVH
jgi:hypothetical protein